MSNPPAAFRALIIYLICIPLALVLGYVLTSPLQWSSFITTGLVLGLLALPVVLRYHHSLLLLGWNATMILFFLPGAPRVWIVLAVISLGISIVQRTIDQDFHFTSVPAVTWPLLALAGVVLMTAEATGGIHLRSTGGDIYGGGRYIKILIAVAGYFALSAQRVPLGRARLCVALFLFGGLTSLISDVFYVNSPALHWLYLFFPASGYLGQAITSGVYRFSGICASAWVFFNAMLAFYGIRGIFAASRPWRLILFVIVAIACLLGGFRSVLASCVMLFAFQFFLEGFHRTKLLPIILLGSTLVALVALPFVRYFPYSIQRTLSFLPISVEPSARVSAQVSTDWRLNMWEAVLPQVPQYLLLGKGLAINPNEFSYIESNFVGNMQAISADQNWAALSGDYHSGPLSIIIPFGIWGMIAFVWFLAAATSILYRNFRYGDPSLKLLNTYLLAAFVTEALSYIFLYGTFYSDLRIFVGYVGVGVCINGRVLRTAPTTVSEQSGMKEEALDSAQLQPAFQQSAAR